jgi:pimeloyl-ACP methyl ester carboxylesterase
MPPRTRYAKSDDVNIAYQVTGDGPFDLVLVPGWVSHIENAWEEPSFARFLHRMKSFCRLILLDRRGTGLSDPVAKLPTLEQRMDDVRAVMDAVESKKAAIFGLAEGGPMGILFAATLYVMRKIRDPEITTPTEPTRRQPHEMPSMQL